jgi:putative transposase
MTNTTDRVEIITGVQRRRRWTAAEKVRLVEETFAPGMTVSLVARQNGIAPNQQWLTDNGSGYVARETRALARDIGLEPRTTPIESPQSNGMAEAFVRTIKRDYARISCVSDAESVMPQLPIWMAHYNEVHPHRALGYRSPHEFIASRATP